MEISQKVFDENFDFDKSNKKIYGNSFPNIESKSIKKFLNKKKYLPEPHIDEIEIKKEKTQIFQGFFQKKNKEKEKDNIYEECKSTGGNFVSSQSNIINFGETSPNENILSEKKIPEDDFSNDSLSLSNEECNSFSNSIKIDIKSEVENLCDSNCSKNTHNLFKIVKNHSNQNNNYNKINLGFGICKKCLIEKEDCITFKKNINFFKHLKSLIISGKLNVGLIDEEKYILLNNIDKISKIMKVMNKQNNLISERNNKFCCHCFLELMGSESIREFCSYFFRTKDIYLDEDHENLKIEKNKKLLMQLNEVRSNVNVQVKQINSLMNSVHLNIQKIIELMLLLTKKAQEVTQEKVNKELASLHLLTKSPLNENLVSNINFVFALVLLEKWFKESFRYGETLENLINCALSNFEKILKFKKSEYYFFLSQITLIRNENNNNSKIVSLLKRNFDYAMNNICFTEDKSIL